MHIAPSILAADFSRLGEQVRAVEAAGAQRIHVDVMDGHFVPNLSMGPEVVVGLRPVTRLPLEVHLMVREPGKFIPAFLKAGADSVIFHLEVVPDPGWQFLAADYSQIELRILAELSGDVAFRRASCTRARTSGSIGGGGAGSCSTSGCSVSAICLKCR